MVGLQIGDSGHRVVAHAAEHGWLVPAFGGPSSRIVSRGCPMALEARIVHLAARKPDRNHVPRSVVVRTPSGRVDPQSSQGYGKAIVDRRSTRRFEERRGHEIG